MKKCLSILLAVCLLCGVLAACQMPGAATPAPASSAGEGAIPDLMRQGKEEFDSQNYGTALETYQKVLDIDPAYDKAYTAMADVHEAMGNIDAAIRILEDGYVETGSSRMTRRVERMKEQAAGGASAPVSSAAPSTPAPSFDVSTVPEGRAAEHEKNLPADVTKPDVFLDYGMHAITTVQLHLRKGPGTDFESILKMDPDMMVEEIGYLYNNSEWVLVIYYANNGSTTYGWCATEYIDYGGGGMAKPVIYLYPEKEMDVDVTVTFADGAFTCTYPDYGDGWHVKAWPDGTVYNYADEKEYSYLYWEAEAEAEWDTTEGYCVKGEDTADFLQKTLAEMGLTPKEYNEFIVYWLPLMKDNPYNYITFQQEAYEEAAQLHVTPKPDSMLRIFMAYQPLSAPVAVVQPKIEAFERTGFAVVEWGGSTVNSGLIS